VAFAPRDRVMLTRLDRSDTPQDGCPLELLHVERTDGGLRLLRFAVNEVKFFAVFELARADAECLRDFRFILTCHFFCVDEFLAGVPAFAAGIAARRHEAHEVPQ
jgi:hypothetical protein